MQGAGVVEAPYIGFLLFIYIRAMWSVGITMVTKEHNPLNPIFWTGYSSTQMANGSLSEQPGWEMPLSLFQTEEQEPEGEVTCPGHTTISSHVDAWVALLAVLLSCLCVNACAGEQHPALI